MRKNNRERERLERVSQHSRYLTPGELVGARLTLASDMVELVLRGEEGQTLPLTMQESLQGLAEVLDALLREARRLP